MKHEPIVCHTKEQTETHYQAIGKVAEAICYRVRMGEPVELLEHLFESGLQLCREHTKEPEAASAVSGVGDD